MPRVAEVVEMTGLDGHLRNRAELVWFIFSVLLDTNSRGCTVVIMALPDGVSGLPVFTAASFHGQSCVV